MAALKLFVIALLATSAYAEDYFLDVKIKKAITNFVDEGQKSFESSIVDFSGEIVNSLEGSGEDLVDIASNKDIQECLQQSVLRFQALAEKAREKLRECGPGSLTELEDLLNRVVEEITKSGNHLAEMYDEVKFCGVDLTCLIEVLRKMVKELMKLKLVVDDMIVEFHNLIKQSPPEVRGCIATAARGLREEFEQIVDDVLMCLSGQL